MPPSRRPSKAPRQRQRPPRRWTAWAALTVAAACIGALALPTGRWLGQTTPASMTWTAIGDMKFGTSGYTDIHDVAFGNGKFVAVGKAGGAYSTDGVTWTAISDIKLGAWAATIAYGNGKFVTAGLNGKGAYSIDGINWTAISDMKFGNGTINSIAYGNGLFVAVGPRKGAYSTDGITWIEVFHTQLEAYDLSDIVYGNGKFVAVGNDGEGAYSTNGGTWTGINNTMLEDWIFGIAYGNGRFVAVDEGGHGATSTNGTAWTAISDMKFGTTPIEAIAFGNGTFVAVGMSGKGSFSSDGITWTAISDMKIGGNIIYGIDYGDTRFVAVGQGGKGSYSGPPVSIASSSSSSSSGLQFSVAASENVTAGSRVPFTVTVKNTSATASPPLHVVFSGSQSDFSFVPSGSTSPASDAHCTSNSFASTSVDCFGEGRVLSAGETLSFSVVLRAKPSSAVLTRDLTVMLGQVGSQLLLGLKKFTITITPPSGVTFPVSGSMTWTEIDDKKCYGPIAAAYGNGKFVIVGPGGGAYSSDGVTWTEISMQMESGVAGYVHMRGNAIAYGNGKFVVVGVDRGWYSLDGVTWTFIADSDAYASAVTFGNGKFVSARGYSPDGVTWTRMNTGISVTSMAYGNGKFVAVASNGLIVHSTDGITWTQSSHRGASLASVAFGNGTFVAVGSGGAGAGGGQRGGMGYYSEDGVTWEVIPDMSFGPDFVVLRAITFGNGMFVTGGDKTNGAYSYDGIVWAQTDTMRIDDLDAITYGNGRFVAVGWGKGSYSGSPVITTAASSSRSSVSGCGNGVIQAGEGCDDGNTRANDGCSASCVVETGWRCSGVAGDRSVCIRDSLPASSSSNKGDGQASSAGIVLDVSAPDTVEQGDFITIGVTVRNQSASARENLLLRNLLLTGFTYVPSQSDGSCVAQATNPQKIDCTQGSPSGFSLPPGGSATFVLVFAVSTCNSPSLHVAVVLAGSSGEVASKSTNIAVTCSGASSASSESPVLCGSSHSSAPSCIAFCSASGGGKCRNMCAHLADIPPLATYLCKPGEKLAGITCSIYPGASPELQVRSSCEYTCEGGGNAAAPWTASSAASSAAFRAPALKGEMCAGFAGISCAEGLTCLITAPNNVVDAGGTCIDGVLSCPNNGRCARSGNNPCAFCYPQ